MEQQKRRSEISGTIPWWKIKLKNTCKRKSKPRVHQTENTAHIIKPQHNPADEMLFTSIRGYNNTADNLRTIRKGSAPL